MEKIKVNRKKILILIGIMLAVTITLTFAYFAVVASGASILKVQANSEGVDKIVHETLGDLSIQMTQFNFGEGQDNLTAESTSVVTLYNYSETETLTRYYDLNLWISYNDFEYSDTTGQTAELILTIHDPNGVEVTKIDGLEYVTVDGVSGFDVTTIQGAYVVADGYAISGSTGTVVHEWDITLTLMNLDVSQNANIEKTFTAYMSFGDEDINFLSGQILEDNGGTEEIEAKDDPDYSTTSGNGVYATEDEYGTSYYFRGVVNNNWVVFGDENENPIYWRIVRIDGEGNIKLIYSGVNAPTSSTSSVMTGTGTQIVNSSGSKTTAFNSSNSSPYYVGYVYTASEMHGTDTDSNAKTEIDYWYENVLEDNYDDYLAETMYCIDRNSFNSTSGGNLNSSYTTSTQYYGTYIRLVTNKTPSLMCTNSDDELYLKAGLISGDEMSLAGWTTSSSAATTTNYLYTGQTFWTLSPYYFSSFARVFYTYSGYLSYGSIYVTDAYGLRPAVSLKSDTLFITGDGTYETPYEVYTN